MPRSARVSEGGLCYHVMSRGNDCAEVFHKDLDYLAFVHLIGDACARLAMRVLAYCLMPNHFHLVLWPFDDGDLSKWMEWLVSTHVRRYRKHYGGWGHVWGGRFKSFPVQSDDHLLTVVRYVERNPVTAGIRTRAEQWRWSSAQWRRWPSRAPDWLAPFPGGLPRSWLDLVNQPRNDLEYSRYTLSLKRQCPFGDDGWVRDTAERLGLESTLRPRGRPWPQKLSA